MKENQKERSLPTDGQILFDGVYTPDDIKCLQNVNKYFAKIADIINEESISGREISIIKTN